MSNHFMPDYESLFRCHECRRGFTRKSSLEKHIRTHYVEPFLRYSFWCHECERGFNQKSRLKAHILAHKNKPRQQSRQQSGQHYRAKCELVHWCHECGMGFGLKTGLENHISTLGNPHSKYLCQCHDCGREFTRKSNMKRHIWAGHFHSHR